jgi:hypothetical protein
MLRLKSAHSAYEKVAVLLLVWLETAMMSLSMGKESGDGPCEGKQPGSCHLQTSGSLLLFGKITPRVSPRHCNQDHALLCSRVVIVETSCE